MPASRQHSVAFLLVHQPSLASCRSSSSWLTPESCVDLYLIWGGWEGEAACKMPWLKSRGYIRMQLAQKSHVRQLPRDHVVICTARQQGGGEVPSGHLMASLEQSRRPLQPQGRKSS